MSLEQELNALLEVERFEPPEAFRKQALLTDPAIYEEAAADPEAWWMRQATELLEWAEEPTQGLDDSDPPFYRWFADGKLNASANCLDRHVEAGIGDRVAYHWRGEEGEERDVTYAELLADVQRFANALRDCGVEKGDVVGIYLPMIPEVVVAMLACARIGAIHNVVFGGFSAESVQGADGVLRGEGAGHRRRGAAQGQDGADQAAGRRAHGWARLAGDDRRRPPHRRSSARCGRDATASTTSCSRRPTRSARPSRSTPSTRSSSSTPRDRRRSRRGSCTRPAATWPG